MIIWIDAQLSPQLAPWLAARFGVTTHAVRDLGLRDATDREIFDAARAASAVVITKDRDFPDLLAPRPAAPSDLGDMRKYIECTHAPDLRDALSAALLLIQSGDALVEITDLP